ncbi:phage holin family protein [Streptomyces sp. NRRL F-2664]|uniref:phage holin family protein n=1 Tax=Streptomyces sp. NRRL F-2664 TaxID=1463842 RepID=UPI0005BA61CF|nr:phage holin family protein [Streptomyces sp. NRRL F-2664]
MALSSHERPMAPARPPAPPPPAAATEPSLGELVSEIGQDLSQLVRDEIELAKAEMKQESAKAGKAVGMLGGAGYAGHVALLFGSLTMVFALAHVMDAAWAALIVTAVWAVVGGVLYTKGRERLRTVNLKPEQTVDTLKEDARWARHLKS